MAMSSNAIPVKEIIARLDDYRNFGISFTWVVDPRTKSGFTYSPVEIPHVGLHTKNPDLNLPVEQLFE